MGYATNQFENFTNYEGPTKDLKRTVDDNPNFIYPDSRVPDIYNPITGNSSTRYTVDTRFQRGFIRGIYPAVLGGTSNPSAAKVKQRRLFFQFNPATIDRSVAMNGETMMPLLQDPAQMFQPINGNAQFSFELLFDRQAEVVMSEYRDNDGNLVTGATLSGSLDNYGANWQQANVSDLGVLADLYVLDSIIGQSITPDMTSFLKDYWNYVDKTVTAYNSTDAAASATSQFNAASFEKDAAINYGNSAFLSPLPIRIVFSSLFMVEGFVTASSVQFMKFTKNYVPTVCRVALDIKALYIGFAREKSYLTDTIAKGIAEQRAEADATAAAVQTATTFSKDSIRFKYLLTEGSKPNVDQVGRTYDTEYSTFKEFFDANSYKDYITFAGTVESYVFKELSEAVKKGAAWSLASAFQMFEYAADIEANNLPKENGWYGKKIMQTYMEFSKNKQGDIRKIDNSEVVNDTNTTNNALSPSIHNWSANATPSVQTIGANSIIVFKILHSINTTISVQGTLTPFTSQVEDTFKLTANSTTDWATWTGRKPTWFLPKALYTGAYQ